MNSFYSPVLISKILKGYFFDINRLRNINDEELKKYQIKHLKKILKFAYTVPLYRDKYRKADVHPDDIKNLEDINKLPTISKDDIKKYYPDGIVSSKIAKNKLIEVSTSGTTGKSITIFVDIFDIVVGLFGYIRSLNEHGINWRKDRLSIIADFQPHTVESGYIHRGLKPSLGSTFLFKNIQWLNTNDPSEKVIKEIDKFKPDFIGGYTGMLGHLALLKEKGYGKNISPRVMASTGGSINNSLRELIEKTFNVEVFESYASTESGPIAFQCKNGGYHVLSDYVYLEYLKNGVSVKSDEPGKLVLTKLYGIGTPIIRYDAINDIVAPLYEKCDCGLAGEQIKKIYGRDDLSFYTTDGKIILPSSFGDIFGRILYELKTNKLKDVRVIQHNLNKIEIQAVINEKRKDVGPSVEKIFSVLKQGFREKFGSNIEILTKEVKKIDRKKPRIISKVDQNKLEIKGYV